MNIVTIDQKKESKILHHKIAAIELTTLDPKSLKDLIKKMRIIMKDADGVGLSANQIGLNMRLFIAEMPREENSPRTKLYTIINPEIVKFSKKKILFDEGCLSIPRVFGPVERAEKVTLVGHNLRGKKIKIKARGFLARIFQHEVDHLNGILFTKHATEVHTVKPQNS